MEQGQLSVVRTVESFGSRETALVAHRGSIEQEDTKTALSLVRYWGWGFARRPPGKAVLLLSFVGRRFCDGNGAAAAATLSKSPRSRMEFHKQGTRVGLPLADFPG